MSEWQRESKPVQTHPPRSFLLVILVFLGGGVPGVGWCGGFGSLFFGVALLVVSIGTSRVRGPSSLFPCEEKSVACEAKSGLPYFA